MADKGEHTAKEPALHAATHRFPQAEFAIRRLMNRNEAFCDMCEELAVAELALSKFTRRSAKPDGSSGKNWWIGWSLKLEPRYARAKTGNATGLMTAETDREKAMDFRSVRRLFQKEWLAKFLREPILHFAVGGAILFAGYAWLDREQADVVGGFKPVRIGDGEVRWLKETWASQWLRQPDAQELQGLVADLVSEELLAREAREMGLDKDDTIVRRRLAQKLKFLVEDTSRLVEPTEAELRQFHQSNAARFQTGARVSFRQIYFNPAQREDAAMDAKAALVDLKSNRGDATTAGDRQLLDAEFSDVDEQAVSAMFGPDFAREVFALAPAGWSEPVKSGYGLHLVSVADASAAKLRPFEEVREEVLREWRREKEYEINRDYLARLREKYGVEIDGDVKGLLGAEQAAAMATSP